MWGKHAEADVTCGSPIRGSQFIERFGTKILMVRQMSDRLMIPIRDYSTAAFTAESGVRKVQEANQPSYCLLLSLHSKASKASTSRFPRAHKKALPTSIQRLPLCDTHASGKIKVRDRDLWYNLSAQL